jgi:kynurenine 3-monooxygenase
MRKVVIAGAGLVGSLLAIWLKQKGFDVELYEKRADTRAKAHTTLSEGRSINLIITSRGLNALAKTNLLSEVIHFVVPVYGRTMHSVKGELAYQPYGRDNSECNYSISRGQLNEFLMDKAESLGVKIHFSHELRTVNFNQHEAAFNFGGTNKTVTYETLFSAEGAGSVARKEFVEFSGSAAQASTVWLDSDYKELILPKTNGDDYAIAKNSLHIWPRGSHMLMALPNRDGSFTMTLYLPKKGGYPSFEKTKTRDEIMNLFNTEFADVVPLMPDLVDDFLTHQQGALGTVRANPWVFEDSFALVGDAAHAIVPFFGQGMNLGFEDCVCLMQSLDEMNGDWASALKKYDHFQRPNANAIADMALENFIEMRDAVGKPDFLLRKKVEAIIESKFADKYRSRYGMIAYTLIPFARAQEAGRIQDRILDCLCVDLKSENHLDLKRAEELINRDLVPFMKSHDISIERYVAGVGPS